MSHSRFIPMEPALRAPRRCPRCGRQTPCDRLQPGELDRIATWLRTRPPLPEQEPVELPDPI